MKVLALYLPQFHSIPENDKWWGKGFTEWTNVRAAKPLFDGHFQPRVPLGNNYYNLLDDDIKKWQIALAKEYGVYGFCVYHYWFKGHLLLEKPMEQYLANKELDLPFCFSWANEHWTNAWTASGEARILIEQDFNDKQDWINHFNYLLPFFKDHRYIKEEGKPLFVIYLPHIIGPLHEMIDCWKELAIQNGLPGIKFIYQSPIFHLNPKYDKSVFDYGIEFQPSMVNQLQNGAKLAAIYRWRANLSNFLQIKFHIYLKLRQKSVKKLSYDEMWEKVLKIKPASEKCIPGAFVDWDNTPRRQERGTVYVGASPEKFKKYFSLQLQHARKEYSTDYLVLFAWNEWAEGGILEPTERYGTAYLQALKEALIENNEFPYPLHNLGE